MSQVDRRRFARFSVQPAYTEALIRLQSEDTFDRIGHVHDISEGGIRFEADVAIEPGTPVALQIPLPRTPMTSYEPDGPGRAVFVLGNVVWCCVDEPGPASMAVAITRFARDHDRERLMRRLVRGAAMRAA
jgi:hypothetical protein